MAVLLDANKIQFDLAIECVVVGGGACGLVAALRLADAKVSSIVLERDARATGSTSLSSGFIPAACTRQQAAQQIKDSPELFAADIQRKAHHQADAQVVQALATQTAQALDWLEQRHGFHWQVLDEFLYPGHSAHRMHCVPGKSGVALQNKLLSACTARGVDIVTQARVDALIVKRTESDLASVCGVRVVRPDDSYEHINSSAVILACNGYGANRELMQRYVPQMANAHYHGHAGNTGDAVYWGEQLGVPLRDMTAYQGHGSVAVGHNILITWALMMEGGIQVNQSGYRFSNELAGYSEQAVNVMQQQEGMVWNIYDQRLHTLGLTFPDYRDAVTAGAIIQAEDISSLAAITGLPEQALRETLETVATLCAQNAGDDFGRRFNADTALQPPYYAVKVAAAVFHTQGGLAIDREARVLHSSGQPVPNLFAAGGAARGVSGSSAEGYLSGNGLLSAVGLGFVAANAVTTHICGSEV